jgi:hypothetical protein
VAELVLEKQVLKDVALARHKSEPRSKVSFVGELMTIAS